MNDRILGIAALALAAFMVWQGHDLQPPFSYEPLGPRAFPLLLSVIIAACGARLVLRPVFKAAPNPPGANIRIAAMFGIVAGYAYLFQILGFVISTALMTMLVARLFSGKWLTSAIGGLVVGVSFFLLFDIVLDVVLPTGLLGNLL